LLSSSLTANCEVPTMQAQISKMLRSSVRL
jgi:hypothetical protein